MLIYKILPSSVCGNACIPPSKSHTLRAVLWAAVSQGNSYIYNYLPSPDTVSMILSCQKMGADISKHGSLLKIKGAKSPYFPEGTVIDAGNSGIAFRFLTAFAAIASENIVITGSEQLARRPIIPLIKALQNFGAKFTYQGNPLPFKISGPLSSGYTEICGSDSQYASALAIACSLSPGPFSFTIVNPKERPWFDLTLWWLDKMHIPYTNSETTYSFPGYAKPQSFTYTVPGDFSSASFIAAAALLSKSPYPTRLENLKVSDIQGDKELFFVLKNLGANILFEEDSITVYPSKFSGGVINMDPFIDALPILTVLCCFAESPSYLYNATGAKNKESDRILTITEELQKMGACIQPCHDGLLINPTPLYGASLNSHNDHRIAMALTIAAMYASSESLLHDTECINKTFPGFCYTMQSLQANIKEYYEDISMRSSSIRKDFIWKSSL
ncbi:3-phosphoshikimate 1-carboxyvinyltransferase [Chlamydia ibidis]|uniref:3-phosphoshikimate 1-carboxyvinyltransferase n=2 Tax=Chlamydia ibidis TaxID=1405396 RepID=S7J3P4_9CHLA|nr:3-phosphoshikimate 1-carboxyvinyltransferase [Chlamydia ibidis]EPP34642.1 3-phosphoshikimate 1-carboxyvinyltransferase [Chlamydia ibidis]EQM62495.1 3-phosphoshikimate 1-carboxyvinyltransferase [Chlamydia ibidis 10-1398/6]